MIESFEGNVLDIKPLTPAKLIFNDGENNLEAIIFIDTNSDSVYTSEGRLDPSLEKKIHEWIENKSREVQAKMMQNIARITPEQAAAMGIDLSEGNSGGGKIITL